MNRLLQSVTPVTIASAIPLTFPSDTLSCSSTSSKCASSSRTRSRARDSSASTSALPAPRPPSGDLRPDPASLCEQRTTADGHQPHPQHSVTPHLPPTTGPPPPAPPHLRQQLGLHLPQPLLRLFPPLLGFCHPCLRLPQCFPDVIRPQPRRPPRRQLLLHLAPALLRGLVLLALALEQTAQLQDAVVVVLDGAAEGHHG